MGAAMAKEYGKHSNYVIVVDVGAGGVAFYLYSWKNPRHRCSSLLPYINELYGETVTGITYLANGTLSTSLTIAFHKMILLIEDKSIKQTVILFRGGQVVRRMPKKAMSGLIETLEAEFAASQFRYSEVAIKLLTPKREMILKWLMVNYAHKVFDNRGAPTYAIVEHDNFEFKIAYQMRGYKDNHTRVGVSGEFFNIVTNSFENLKMDSLDIRVKSHLNTLNVNTNDTVNNPCMLKGHTSTTMAGGIGRSFDGTGNSTLCQGLLLDVLHDIKFVDHPFFTYNVRFIMLGFSHEFCTKHGIVGAGGLYNTTAVHLQVEKLCGESYSSANVSERDHLCLEACYFHNLYVLKLGIVSGSDGFYLYKPDVLMGSFKYGWTLGAMLTYYEKEKEKFLCAFDSSRLETPVLIMLVCMLIVEHWIVKQRS